MIVQLRSHEGLAWLESTGGKVVPESGRHRLEGPFQLVLSVGIAENPQFIKTQSFTFGNIPYLYTYVSHIANGNYLLEETLENIDFNTNGNGEDIQADLTAPLLRFKQIKLHQTRNQSLPARLSLPRFSLWLCAPTNKEMPDGKSLHYPSQHVKDASTALKGFPHPNEPGTQDCYLLPDHHSKCHVLRAGGFLIPLGIEVGRFQGVHIQVSSDFELSFLFSKVHRPQPPLVISTASFSNKIKVIVHEKTECAVSTPSLGASSIGADFLEIGANQAKVHTFHYTPWNDLRKQSDGLLTIARYGKSFDSANFTGLVASQDKVTFYLPLRPKWDSKNQSTSTFSEPRFLYHDPDISSESNAHDSLKRRNYQGLRIRGLRSSAGSQARVDASTAQVVLLGGNNKVRGIFHFQGGIDLNFPDVKDSILLPKPYFDDNGEVSGRRLDIGAGQLVLRIESRWNDLLSRFVFNTAATNGKPHLVVLNPSLLSPPLGSEAVSGQARTNALAKANSTVEFAQWSQSANEIGFMIGDERLKPVDGGKWTTRFKNPAPSTYDLVRYPGAQLTINPTWPSVHADQNLTTIYEWEKDVDGKERAVYSGIFALLIYYLANKSAADPAIKSFHGNVAIGLTNLTKAMKDYVKANGSNDLLVVFTGDSGKTPIQEFVNLNVPELEQPSGPKFDKVILDLDGALKVLLWRRKAKGGEYAPDIIEHRPHPLKDICLAFDLSTVKSLSGIELPRFSGLAKDDPEIWPVASKPQPGAQEQPAMLDPSAPSWRGIFLRHFPLTLALTHDQEKAIEGLDLLNCLIKIINEHAYLDYGWIDETGASWKIGLGGNDHLLSPDKWKHIIKITLKGFFCVGRNGNALSAEALVDITFPAILRSKTQDPKGKNKSSHKEDPQALGCEGRFKIDFGQERIAEFIEIAIKGDPLETTHIPGFSKITLSRFFTDFKTAKLEMLLKPDQYLKAVLPFLNKKEDIKATLAMVLDSEVATSWIDVVFHEHRTSKLFDTWSVTVQGMRIDFGTSTGTRPTVRIKCRVNLGLLGYESVGGTITIAPKDTSNWTVSFALDEINWDFKLASYSVEGSLAWGDECSSDEPTPPEAKDVFEEGQKRVLRGHLTVGGNGNTKTGLFVKIKNSDETPYWAAGYLGKLSLGGLLTIEHALILVARHCDHKDNLLRQSVTDLSSRAFKKLTVKDDGAVPTFLTDFAYKADIGTVIALTGYLSPHPDLMNVKTKEPDNLTGLIISDSGFARIEAYTELFKIPTRFSVGIDTVRQSFSASFALPKIEFDSSFLFHPGPIGITVTPDESIVSFGFPTKTQTGNWDWSGTNRIVISDMAPLNTFEGGWAIRKDKNGNVGFGIAARAGWTKRYEVGGSGVGGAAELGIMIGGVFIIVFGRFTRSSTPYSEHSIRAGNGPLLIPVAAPPTALDYFAESGWTGQQGEARLSQVVEQLGESPSSLMLLAHRIILELAPPHRFHRMAIDCISADILLDAWGVGHVHVLGVTVAGISISARARLNACGPVKGHTIAQLTGHVSFDLSVTIGCVRYSVTAIINFKLIDKGECVPCLAPPSQAPEIRSSYIR